MCQFFTKIILFLKQILQSRPLDRQNLDSKFVSIRVFFLSQILILTICSGSIIYVMTQSHSRSDSINYDLRMAKQSLETALEEVRLQFDTKIDDVKEIQSKSSDLQNEKVVKLNETLEGLKNDLDFHGANANETNQNHETLKERINARFQEIQTKEEEDNQKISQIIAQVESLKSAQTVRFRNYNILNF